MANKLPCPNPTCTHEFSQAELQAAAQLACPKCGFRMQGRAAAPAAPAAKPVATPVKPAAPKPAAPPLAQPIAATPAAKIATAQPIAARPSAKLAPPLAVAAPPKPVEAAPPPENPFALDFLAAKPSAKPAAKPAEAAPASDNPFALPLPAKPSAKPVAAAPPAAAPVNAEESLPDGAFFNPEVAAAAGSLVRRTAKPKKPFNWMRLAVITCAIGFAASIVIISIVSVLWLLLGTEAWGDLTSSNVDGAIYWHNIRGANGNEKAFKLVLPKESWEIDKEIQTRFDANAAWKRKDDDFWFAVCVKDYGMQKPRDAAMLKVAVDKLEGHFGEALELAAKAEPDKYGDLPAQKLQFKGQSKSANWLGECWMFFKDGIAYWVFVASPEWQKITDFEEEMATRRIVAAVERRGWREQPWPMETFQSDNGKVTMTAPKGVWARHDAKSEDQNGQLFLFGTFTGEKDNRKNAQLLVFTFERKEDLKAALVYGREYLEKRDDNENKNFKVVLADDLVKGQTEIGTAQPVGDRPGRVIDLKRLFDNEPKRYFLLAVVNDPDAAYGIVCECTWESRQIWRSDFLDVLHSARFKK